MRITAKASIFVCAFGLLAAAHPFSLMRRTMYTFKQPKDDASAEEREEAAQYNAMAEQAFKDSIKLASAVEDSDYDGDIFKKYFQESDKEVVKNINTAIVGGDKTNGADVLANIITDYQMLSSSCKVPTWEDGEVTGGFTMAFTINGVKKDKPWDKWGAKIRMCPAALRVKKLDDISCSDIGDELSANNALSTGGIVLHEFMHFNPFGRLIGGEEPADGKYGSRVWIDDLKLANGDAAYGVFGTRKLREEEPDKCTKNADNYNWFVNEVYFSKKCGKANFKAPSDKFGDRIQSIWTAYDPKAKKWTDQSCSSNAKRNTNGTGEGGYCVLSPTASAIENLPSGYATMTFAAPSSTMSMDVAGYNVSSPENVKKYKLKE